MEITEEYETYDDDIYAQRQKKTSGNVARGNVGEDLFQVPKKESSSHGTAKLRSLEAQSTISRKQRRNIPPRTDPNNDELIRQQHKNDLLESQDSNGISPDEDSNNRKKE